MAETQNIPYAVLIIMYILGMSSTLPWNFFITADAYWQYKLRNTTLGEDWDDPENSLNHLQYAFMPALVIISTGLNFVFTFFTSTITRRVPERQRILGSFLLILAPSVIIIAFSILNTDNWQVVFFAVTLLMVAIMNVGIAVFEASLFGMVGSFPPRCITALLSGLAFSGIVSSLSEIISLAIGNEDPVISGIIYFCAAAGFIIFSLGCYVKLIKMDYYVHKKKTNVEEKHAGHEHAPVQVKVVLKKVIWMGFTILFTMLVTLSIYPSVQVYVTSSHTETKWGDVYFQPTITFLLFNVMDMLGRELFGYLKWPSHDSLLRINMLTIGRVIFIPLMLLCNGDNKRFPIAFHHDFVYIIINCLFGLSNGYMVTLAMVYYPKKVSNAENETGGAIMAGMMCCGMLLGSLISPLFVLIWGPNVV